MGTLSFIYRQGIWISIVIFILAVYLLATCITGVIRTVRQARLFSVRLVEEQQVEFATAGPVVMAMEGPILSRRFAHLKYELEGPGGAAVPSQAILFRSRSSGFTKARMDLRTFDIPAPGQYTFRIQGLGAPQPSDPQHAMVFSRPHLPATMAYVLGIVFTGILTMGSIVFFGIRVAGVGLRR
jgi:hypothetical protein